MIGRLARSSARQRPAAPFLPALLAVYAVLATVFCARLFAVPAGRVLGGNLPSMGGDFLALSTGGRIVHEGHGARLYNLATQAEAQAAILHGEQATELALFVYPPFVALGFAALAGLSPLAAYLAWLAVNLALLGLAIAALAALGDQPGERGKRALILTLAAAGFLPTWAVLTRGQMSFVMLVALAGGILALRRGHDLPAGLCLALGMVKPQLMIVPLIVLLFTRRWRALAGLALGGLVLGSLALATAGPAGVGQYLRVLAQVGTETGASSPVHPSYMFNWRGTAVRLVAWLLGPDNAAVTAAALGAYALLSLLTIVCLLWAWHKEPRAGRGDLPGLWALTILAGMLASPHLHEYDLCLWLLAGTLIVDHARENTPGHFWPVWLAVAHVLPLATIMLNQVQRAHLGALVSVSLAALTWRLLQQAGRGA